MGGKNFFLHVFTRQNFQPFITPRLNTIQDSNLHKIFSTHLTTTVHKNLHEIHSLNIIKKRKNAELTDTRRSSRRHLGFEKPPDAT